MAAAEAAKAAAVTTAGVKESNNLEISAKSKSQVVNEREATKRQRETTKKKRKEKRKKKKEKKKERKKEKEQGRKRKKERKKEKRRKRKKQRDMGVDAEDAWLDLVFELAFSLLCFGVLSDLAFFALLCFVFCDPLFRFFFSIPASIFVKGILFISFRVCFRAFTVSYTRVAIGFVKKRSVSLSTFSIASGASAFSWISDRSSDRCISPIKLSNRRRSTSTITKESRQRDKREC